MNNLINKLNKLEIETSENIKSSKSVNTLRAYKADFSDFNNFCKTYNLRPLPATCKTVSMYITQLSKKSKFSTLKRRLAAIKVYHKLNGSYIDLKNPIISENLTSIKKKIGIFQKAKKPLSINDLKKIINEIEKEKKEMERFRNKALILIGFAGAFRRSELVSLMIDDLDFVDEGVKIFVKKSKTDQSGEGMIKAIPYFNNKLLCPVNSLKNWLSYLNNMKITGTKIFNMSDKNVSLIVKKYTSKIGLESFKYSGHSLRSGFATSTAESGADERQIMNMTGHKSSQMVRRYIHQSNLFKQNALKKLDI